MNKVLTLFFVLIITQPIISQSLEPQRVIDYLKVNTEKYNLTEAELSSFVVLNQYVSSIHGGTHVYLNQTFEGIPIKNAIISSVLKDNKVVAVASSAVTNTASFTNTRSTKSISATDGLVHAARSLGIASPEFIASSDRADNGDLVFSQSNFTRSPIKARQIYVLHDDQLIKTWEYDLDMASSPDYWQLRVDVATGMFISKNNFTVYCNHDTHFSSHSPLLNLGTSKPHVHHKSSNSAMDAMYKVIPLPYESPAHGDHVLIPSPHYMEASPFGWHDINGVAGPEFKITRGNNVFAYPDRNDDNSPDNDLMIPDGGDDLFFDFPFDPTKEAVANASASVVNLFYMNNMMHDLMHLYGFDEVSGNFQQKNYTNLGNGNDYVVAEAMDGSMLNNPEKFNNANFSTPTDGNSGRMQMYLWNAPNGALNITLPENIALTSSEFTRGNFGSEVPKEADAALEGIVKIVDNGNPQFSSRGCGPLVNDLTGAIALIDRGECDFSEKAYRAQRAGAIACIICNVSGIDGGDGEELVTMGGQDFATEVTILPLFVKKSFCDIIKIEMAKGSPVTIKIQEKANSGPAFFDASFDQSIIAHEYGHGISTRLTGGPSISSCLSNDEQMGEGWSDFFSLVTTVQVGDVGPKPRGVATYSAGGTPTNRGIRNYPYSTDLAVNPLTFENIKTTGDSPHQLGVVWTAMLWDLYWAFVEEYGYDPDWRNLESGNAKALLLVMEGMKVQACSPGFIEGRDAILAADLILNDGINDRRIWEVFARRGLGFFATGGSTNNRTDGTQSFEIPPYFIPTLKVYSGEPGLVNPASTIKVTIDVVNHIDSSLQVVSVEDEIPAGATLVAGSSSVPAIQDGSRIIFDAGKFDFEETKTITYSYKLGSESSKSAFLLDVDSDDQQFEIIPVEGFSTWTISFDHKTSGELSFYVGATAQEEEHTLVTPAIDVVGEYPVLRFWQLFETEGGTDGGFIQISTDGVIWENIDDLFIYNGYTGPLSYDAFAIPEIHGFYGSTNGEFIDSYIDLSSFKGQTVFFRFRFATNDNTTVTDFPFPGWYIDDIELLDLLSYDNTACAFGEENELLACTPSRKILINTSTMVSTSEENVIDAQVYLHPNPANSHAIITADTNMPQDAKLEIMSSDGRKLYSENVNLGIGKNEIPLPISNLASGIYLVRLYNEGFSVTRKLSKL